MADDDIQDQSEKTEEPTSRRLEQAIKKGQVPSSREVTSFLLLAFFTLLVLWGMGGVMQHFVHTFTPFIAAPDQFELDSGTARHQLSDVIKGFIAIMFVPVIGTVFIAVLSNLLQHGWVVSLEPIIPKLEKISPLKGLERLFSLRSVMEFVKGLIKISIVAIIFIIVLRPHLDRLDQVVDYDVIDLLELFQTLLFRMLLGATIVMMIIAMLDFFYQKHEHLKKLRMSRKEIKDEFKETEGDPHVKAKLKQIRTQRAKQRMMQKVPKADVVITNPTHYAVALQYDQTTMQAPVVVAKGVDALAQKIKEVAREHTVPAVQNPSLARALYDAVEVEEEIPLEHYKAVAEVIGYVYKLKGRKVA